MEKQSPLLDANYLYQASKKAISSSSFKYETQKYRMNWLIENALLQKEIAERFYTPREPNKFILRERGKTRNIASNNIRDRVVNHCLCDEIVTPSIDKFLIYDNCASQINRGVSQQRDRLKFHLMKYYKEYNTNEGWVLLIDFKNYYGNINHELSKTQLCNKISADEITKFVINQCFTSFNGDVGIDIGNQLSQNIGILFPYKIDNYVKIVEGMKYYGRYTDDSYIIYHDKEKLQHILNNIINIAAEHNIIIHPNKTRIIKLRQPFYFLKVKYHLRPDGKVATSIHPKTLTRIQRRLKAYKHLLEEGRLTQECIENAFKAWLGCFWKIMTVQQIQSICNLYKELFGGYPKWKRKSRLNYLMTHSLSVS